MDDSLAFDSSTYKGDGGVAGLKGELLGRGDYHIDFYKFNVSNSQIKNYSIELLPMTGLYYLGLKLSNPSYYQKLFYVIRIYKNKKLVDTLDSKKLKSFVSYVGSDPEEIGRAHV